MVPIRHPQNKKTAQADVAHYYDVITAPYRAFWGDYFHPAISSRNDRPAALRETHDRFIRDAKLRPGDSFIDLGSGCGGLTCLVAERCHARALGITISRYQVGQARKLAKRWGVKNVTFQLFDIMEVDRIGEQFNAAFLIDVGCHLPDKSAALKKISRVLQPGGRLVIADWLQREKPSALERELLLEPLNRYWHFPYMESLSGYRTIIARAGLTLRTAEDVSEKTKKTWDYFYDLAVREVRRMNLHTIARYVANPAVLGHPRQAIATAKNQFYANTFTRLCFDAGVFRYGYLVCEKA